MREGVLYLTGLCSPQLSDIRSRGVPEREKALKEKREAIAVVQGRVEAESSKQKELERDLEHIRSLEPKVHMDNGPLAQPSQCRGLWVWPLCRCRACLS